MIEHIVLFKVRADVTPQEQEAMMDALRALGQKVPGILEISAGANTSQRSRGYTHGLVVRLTDRAALDAYLPHPAHQEVVARFVKPLTDEILVVDYEL